MRAKAKFTIYKTTLLCCTTSTHINDLIQEKKRQDVYNSANENKFDKFIRIVHVLACKIISSTINIVFATDCSKTVIQSLVYYNEYDTR